LFRSVPAAPIDPVSSKPSTFTPPRLARWLSPLLILAAWQVASMTGLLPEETLGSPSQIAHAAWTLIQSGQLQSALLVSLKRVGGGILLGVTLAVVIGTIAGLSRWGDVLLDPPMQMLKAIPLYGVVPLFIIWFGIGETPKIILIALGVMVPLYLSLSAALRGVPGDLVEVATTLRLNRRERIRHVIVPAALPGTLVGLRLSLAVAWLVLIVSETINADSGIGFIINNARNFLQTNIVVVGLLTYALLGVFTDFLVRLVERRALRYQGGVRR
jgi:sulfonate transport system permease protein